LTIVFSVGFHFLKNVGTDISLGGTFGLAFLSDNVFDLFVLVGKSSYGPEHPMVGFVSDGRYFFFVLDFLYFI